MDLNECSDDMSNSVFLINKPNFLVSDRSLDLRDVPVGRKWGLRSRSQSKDELRGWRSGSESRTGV